MSENKCTRRNFLAGAGWLATLGTFGGLAVASGRYLFPNVLYEPPLEFKIASPEEYPEGVTFVASKRIFVIREQNLIKVVSGVCTHIGCTVRWSEERNRFECPCHGSMFSANGAVTAGPAPKPLPWYEVSLAPDGRLLVKEDQIVPFQHSLTV
ncbi:MAG: Rieske 2Fe-2S domain-containing protein [Syntrophobacteraceae bacterium]|nr:Rieske 2Fe-2S domain-containing protein [Syntrophobacteraceae bacterium]